MRVSWLVLILTEILALSLEGRAVCRSNDTDSVIPGETSTRRLSRRRRLTFPQGSTFVITLAVLQAIQLRLPTNWFLDFEFDVIWPIPNQESLRKKFSMKRPSKLKRRHRRDLYTNIEAALNSRSLPGRRCVLRTICEAKLLPSPPGISLLEDVIRLFLRNDDEDTDQDEIDAYDIAHRVETACHLVYPCPFSILQLLLFHLYADSWDER